ncbi:MAG: histidinol dehydrogenase, partial [Candidatus Rokuibacteriota bacterium]
MIRVLDARTLGLDRVVVALARPPAAVRPEIHRAVDGILADVRTRGDAALLELTARFDGFTAATATELVITPDEFETAERQLAPDVRAALAYAAERIE